MKKLLITSVTILFLFALGTAQAVTVYVPDDYSTIQGAIAASSSGDTIVVRPGTYNEIIDFLGRAVTLQSEKGPEATTIDGDQLWSVVTFQNAEGPDTVLDGFTITNGTGQPWGGEGAGGGVFCNNGTGPTITNNIVTGNEIFGSSYGNAGGGIACAP